MRQILRKDLIREVKKSFARFISIAILVGMGTTFFVGLNSAAPNMLKTADDYLKKNNYQDIKVIAPVEFMEADVQELKKLPLVAEGSLGYLVQTLTAPNNLTVEIVSFQKSHYDLIDGRFPKKSGELVLDNKAQKEFSLGETLTFHLDDDSEETAIKDQVYEIVGFVNSSRFISKNARGVTSIGDGSLDIFGVILEADFILEAPNTIDLELRDSTRKKFLYGPGYDNDLQKAKAQVDEIIKDKVDTHSLEITDELKDQELEIRDEKNDLVTKKEKLTKEQTNLSIDQKQLIADQKTAALNNYDQTLSLLKNHQNDLQELEKKAKIALFAFESEEKRLISVEKQLAEQRETYNRYVAQADFSEEKRLELEETYFQLYTDYQENYAFQQVELGKLTVIRTKVAELQQLVQLEQSAIPDLDTLKKEFADLEKERADGQKKLEDQLIDLNEGITELEESGETIDLEKKKAAIIPYLIEGIDDTETFRMFRENVERLDIISQVIPFIFFFVAFIITTTLILRMIHQSREQIGTFLAMGIKRQDIIRKYTLYSVISSTIGMVIGIYAGIFPFTQVIISLYSPMYIFPAYDSQFNLMYVGLSVIATVLSVVVIPYLVYSKMFKVPALHLLKPKEAQSGSKLLIERWPRFWRQLPFSLQRTLRNINTYKVRMGVLLIGFIGCMSLLYVGYGARSSVDQLQKNQFYNVLKYDALVSLTEVTSKDEKDAYTNYMINEIDAERCPIFQEKWESVTTTNDRIETFIISPENSEQLSHFITLKDVKTNEALKLKANDVFITEKLANVLELKIGDTWEIVNSDGVKISPKITNIIKNYYLHYAYIGEDAYEQLFQSSGPYDDEFINVKNWNEKDSKELLKLEAVQGVLTRAQEISKMEEMTNQLNTLLIIIILAAVLLGLVVLYNLAYITILERKQEIAMLQAIGYRKKQVTAYIFREIFLLGFVGVLLGEFCGIILHKVVMAQVELEFLFFPEIEFIKVSIQAGATLFVIGIILLVLMHHKIKQINTVEALKVKE